MFRARTIYCPFIFVVVEMGYEVFNIYAERVDQWRNVHAAVWIVRESMFHTM